MKKITLLFLLMFSASVFAQVQKLSELSSGKFIDSKIIFEEGSDDVYGYLLLYESDRKSREVYDLEYVVLDKNLNKTSSGQFTHGAFKHLLAKLEIKLSYVRKIKDELFFGIYDYIRATGDPFLPQYLNHRYRKLNLTTYTLSEEFFIKDQTKAEIANVEGDVLELSDIRNYQTLYPTNNGNFVLFSQSEYKRPKIMGGEIYKYIVKTELGVKSFSVVDKDLNTLWTKAINADKESGGSYSYNGSDKDALVIRKDILDSDSKIKHTLEIYDLNNGSRIAELTDQDANFQLYQDQIAFTDDEVILYYYMYGIKEKEALMENLHEKSQGYARIIIDKKTGNEVRRDYMSWENLKPHLNVTDKMGTIANYGKIIVHEFIPLKNGNTLAVAEGYNKKEGMVLDMFMLELDADMKIKTFNKTEKRKKPVSNSSGQNLKRFDKFDFNYSQKLDNNENYVFLYANNDRDGKAKEMEKDPNWVMGIITYVDGVFASDKLPLTSKESQIYPGLAKRGYVRLLEVGQDDKRELRLEKINY